jgi:hypothetical protein
VKEDYQFHSSSSKRLRADGGPLAAFAGPVLSESFGVDCVLVAGAEAEPLRESGVITCAMSSSRPSPSSSSSNENAGDCGEGLTPQRTFGIGVVRRGVELFSFECGVVVLPMILLLDASGGGEESAETIDCETSESNIDARFWLLENLPK